MQLACMAWVEVLDTSDDGQKKTDSVKNISFDDCVTFFPLVIC